MAPSEQQIKQWVVETIAQKREIPHLDFKREATTDKLLKDIVAMYNTPDSPFDGYGYIVVGIHNDQTVHGLTADDRRSNPTADKRETSLRSALTTHTMPIPTVRVIELTLEAYPDAPLHVIEVPTTPGVWSYIHTDRKDNGYYVRRGTESVPPKPPEVEAYLQRLLFSRTEDMRRELTGLQAIAGEHRHQLNHLTVQHAPSSATNAQILSATFNTPERTLLRTVRSEIATYLSQHAKVDYTLYYFPLERQLDEHLVPNDKIEEVRHLLSRLEELTRPLVELLGILAHDVELPQRESSLFATLEQALAEIGNAVLFTGPTPDYQPTPFHPYNAIHAYPAIMLMFASAALSVSSPPRGRWFVLEKIFQSQRPYSFFDGQRQPIYLASHWEFRPVLDYLIKLFDRTYPNYSASERMENLMRETDWLGQYMPATEARRLVSDAEVVVSLAHLGAALQRGAEPRFVPAAWMYYTDAQAQIRSAMEHISGHALLSLAGDQNTWHKVVSVLEQQLLENRAGPLQISGSSR